MAKYPVVVYGASGYTGMLIMDWLIDQQIPFTAVARNAARVKEMMAERVVRLESATFEIVEAEHTVASLAKAFRGAKVVCATVGPFAQYGATTVEAALEAGCHLLDTTGEQSYVLDMRDRYGERYRQAGLLLSPSTAYMYTFAEIAAELALETPGIDCIETGTLCRGTRLHGRRRHGGIHGLDLRHGAPEAAVPLGEAARGAPGHRVLQRRRPELHAADLLAALERDVAAGLLPARRARQELHLHGRLLRQRRDEARARLLPEVGSRVQGPAGRAPGRHPQGGRRLDDASMPPRERTTTVRTVDFAIGRGQLAAVRATVHGVTAYISTGALQPPPRSSCSTARRTASASPRPARRSATATCSASSSSAGSRARPSPSSERRRMAIIDFFDRGWRINPGGVAYVQDERSFSFDEVGELSCRIANGLLAEGFAKETKGAVWAGNDVTAWACTLGLWRANMCWIPVGARNPAEENQYVLDAFDCEVLFFQRSYAPAIAGLRSRLRRCGCGSASTETHPSCRKPGHSTPGSRCSRDAAGGRRRHGRRGHAVVDGRHNRPAEGRDEHPPQRADLLRALHDGLHVRRGREAREPRGGADDAHGRPALDPLHGARRHGRRVTRPDPALMLAAIPKHRVTELFLPPTVIYRLLDIPDLGKKVDFSSLKYFMYGAAPMSVEKLKLAIEVIGRA